MGNAINEIMPELLSVMKDMASLLEKQDATQERAKLDKPPKTGEDQKPIVGGTAPGFKPGEGIAKEFPTLPKRVSPQTESTEIDEGTGTLLKEDEEAEAYAGEESPEEEAAEEEEQESSEVDELKSLLKSIVLELRSIKKSQATSNKADIQKAVRAEADHMLRKMGFTPTRPDVVRIAPNSMNLGVDQSADIKKSSDEIIDVKKSSVEDLGGQDLSGLSWRELGSIREASGGFNPFLK